MGILIIDNDIRARVATLIERARAKPVLWETMRDGAIADNTNMLTLDQRKPGLERPPSQHITLGSYRACYSIEQQPIGMCRHLSISAPKPGRVPNEPVVCEIMELFGFVQIGMATNQRPGRIWLEEFDPGHFAVNIVQLIEPAQEGHA